MPARNFTVARIFGTENFGPVRWHGFFLARIFGTVRWHGFLARKSWRGPLVRIFGTDNQYRHGFLEWSGTWYVNLFQKLQKIRTGPISDQNVRSVMVRYG